MKNGVLERRSIRRDGHPVSEAFGARLFRQGKPRAVLEVKSPSIPTAMYEARLRGYDRAKADKERKDG